MKPIRHKSISFGVIVLLLLVLSFGGCIKSGIQIVTVPNEDVLVLNADQVVQIMAQAGFSQMQIREYGWAMREGLARTGRVHVIVNKTTEAIFAIKGNEVYIGLARGDRFIYNINTGRVSSMQGR